MADPKEPRDHAPTPVSGCLLQIVWSMLGPGVVLIAGCIVVIEERPVGSAPDWVLLGAVLAAVVARTLDRAEPGTAAAGEATPPGRAGYAAWVAGAGAMFFALGHFVAPFLP